MHTLANVDPHEERECRERDSVTPSSSVAKDGLHHRDVIELMKRVSLVTTSRARALGKGRGWAASHIGKGAGVVRKNGLDR